MARSTRGIRFTSTRDLIGRLPDIVAAGDSPAATHVLVRRRRKGWRRVLTALVVVVIAVSAATARLFIWPAEGSRPAGLQVRLAVPDRLPVGCPTEGPLSSSATARTRLYQSQALVNLMLCVSIDLQTAAAIGIVCGNPLVVAVERVRHGLVNWCGYPGLSRR